MSATRYTCSRCGQKRRRSNPETTVCLACRRADRSTELSDVDILTGGRWVTQRGVQRWVADPSKSGDFWTRLGYNLATKRGAWRPPTRPEAVICECGCLLAHRFEDCPDCRTWAIRAERLHNMTRRAA